MTLFNLKQRKNIASVKEPSYDPFIETEML